jgi:hypothetical protein
MQKLIWECADMGAETWDRERKEIKARHIKE